MSFSGHADYGIDVAIRGFMSRDFLPDKAKDGRTISYSTLPDTACENPVTKAPVVEPDITVAPDPLAGRYYRVDRSSATDSGYGTYGVNRLNGQLTSGFVYLMANTTAVTGGGVARAVVPETSLFRRLDWFDYCDANGAGNLITPGPVRIKGKVRIHTLAEASMKPRAAWS